MNPANPSTQAGATPARAAAVDPGPAGRLVLELEDVSVGYGTQAVLDGVNLGLRQGSFTGLVGPNGSGKTTLLRTILGLLPPLRGRMTLHPVEGRAPVLGYVPQRESLDPGYLFSAYEIALMGTYGRVPAGRRPGGAEKECVLQCLEETGAADLARQRFANLSGGQKQRVLIARALAARPDFLLLDEPTAGIDAAASRTIMDMLGRIHRERGLTIIIVNHDLPLLRKTVQDVIWVHDGEVRHGQVGDLLTPERIEAMLALRL